MISSHMTYRAYDLDRDGIGDNSDSDVDEISPTCASLLLERSGKIDTDGDGTLIIKTCSHLIQWAFDPFWRRCGGSGDVARSVVAPRRLMPMVMAMVMCER